MLERIIHGCSVYIYRVWNTFDSALLYVLLRLWFSFGEELKGAETESIVHFEKKEGGESQNIKEKKIQKPTKDREAIEGGNGEKIDEKTWGFEKKRRKRKRVGEKMTRKIASQAYLPTHAKAGGGRQGVYFHLNIISSSRANINSIQ